MSTQNNNQQTHTFYVSGMHCNACILVTESELEDVSYITKAKSNLNTDSVEITGNFGDKEKNVIAQDLTQILLKHGYTLSTEKINKNNSKIKNWSDFKIAIPIAITFAILFLLLQKIGLVNLINGNNVSYGTAFVIGIIASLSTCMAVVGGLVLSMSATFAKEGDKVRPQLFFHGGRIVSFFIFGGVIGSIGSAFTLSASVSFTLSIIIGIVMLILGINLLGVLNWAKRLQPSMPKYVSKHALGVLKFNHTLTPILVGIVTFFLPCGFTQSMQLYTLTTGSFLKGGLTMLAFALGTLPILALVSFSSFGIQNSSKAGIFFKTAGLIVIMFAVFNLINSLVVIGVIPPIFNL